jgi:hypothetical protein
LMSSYPSSWSIWAFLFRVYNDQRG